MQSDLGRKAQHLRSAKNRTAQRFRCSKKHCFDPVAEVTGTRSPVKCPCKLIVSVVTRKKRSITLSIEAREKADLEQLALDFGQTWGDKPNISKLIKAIAQGKLRLAANHDWSHGRIDTLNRILGWLKDNDLQDEALVLATLLLERSELSDPLRHEIQAWVDRPNPLWRTEIDRYIRQRRPFYLTYQDAADRPWTFTVRHAGIARYEDRHYLDCWCDETAGNQDIAPLQHNWSLRIDRIPTDARIASAPGHWQPELDVVEVEFHLLRGLAYGYRSKTDTDIMDEWLPDRSTRRIVRRIRHTFWFFRALRCYGADCIIIGPPEVRDRFSSDVLETYRHYWEPKN